MYIHVDVCITSYNSTFLCMLAGSDEYCASESFDASCGHNEAILMETANYGRMEGGRCIR